MRRLRDDFWEDAKDGETLGGGRIFLNLEKIMLIDEFYRYWGLDWRIIECAYGPKKVYIIEGDPIISKWLKEYRIGGGLIKSLLCRRV